MFGSFRLLLACMVALSHIGITVYGQNIGVIAVIGFYLLSGYVMTDLIDTRFRGFGNFYTRRIQRIFPLYAAALGFAVLLYISGAGSPFISNRPDLLSWVSNMLIFPLNYYMFSGIDKFTLIPPAWSLGLELQYYLLIPIIIRCLSKRLYYLIFLVSATIFCAAQIQLLHTEYFGYRLLPGMLVIFMSGGILSRINNKTATQSEIALLGLFSFSVIAILLFSVMRSFHIPFNQETMIGFVLTLTSVWIASRHRRYLLDEWMGFISYGVFLFHFPTLWLMQLTNSKVEPLSFMLVTITLSLLSSLIVEKRLWKRSYKDISK